MPSTRARLSIADACTVIGDAGFGARLPGVGLELEWFVVDAVGRRVTDPTRVRAALDEVVAPAVENMPGGRAIKPGDIVAVAGLPKFNVADTLADERGPDRRRR